VNPVRPNAEETHRNRVVRERLPFLIGATLLVVVTAAMGGRLLVWPAGLLALLVFWFFRDPRRTIPAEPKAVVSPADGRVVKILEMEENEFLKAKAVRISIFLNIFNVHVNRVPVTGRIRRLAYRPGKFLAAQSHKASEENEQNTILIETPDGARLLFVQIAGLIARRIVCWIGEGDLVERGQRFGLIRFGSRMDVYLPPSTSLRVRVGDPVKGGETLLGVLS
jgi:phosphatidylserine decarboxylase